MIIHLDPTSPVPAYEQVRAQIATAIHTGRLDESHQLPPIRQLAHDLDLAPGTVARAYRQLETAGLVISNRRRSTRVAAKPDDAAPEDRQLRDAAGSFADLVIQRGISPEQACNLLLVEISNRRHDHHTDPTAAPTRQATA
ncbi:MAG: GntR family transcriptional regulator [Nitriliruptoraceae bacterium]